MGKVHAVHFFLGRKFPEVSTGVKGVHSGLFSQNFPLLSRFHVYSALAGDVEGSWYFSPVEEFPPAPVG